MNNTGNTENRQWKSDPSAWHVDDDVRIVGYHHYAPGKTVRTLDYFRNNPNPEWIAGLSLDPTTMARAEMFYGEIKVMITPKRGQLIGSTAIAQIPNSSAFIRVHAKVHTGRTEFVQDDEGDLVLERVGSDLGKGSKAFGRRIATERLLKALDKIVDTVTFEPNLVPCAATILDRIAIQDFKLYERLFDSGLIEIVDECDLTPTERSLLRLPNTVETDV